MLSQVLGMLTPIERQLMSVKLRDLERCLDPGFSPLNWNSLGIPDFIAACSKATNEFHSLVNQVRVCKHIPLSALCAVMSATA